MMQRSCILFHSLIIHLFWVRRAKRWPIRMNWIGMLTGQIGGMVTVLWVQVHVVEMAGAEEMAVVRDVVAAGVGVEAAGAVGAAEEGEVGEGEEAVEEEGEGEAHKMNQRRVLFVSRLIDRPRYTTL